MKSEAYQAYKTYICNDPEYINLMFKSFLFKQFKGLNGYLIDDIIQTRYPLAPSIRAYVEKRTIPMMRDLQYINGNEKYGFDEYGKRINNMKKKQLE